MIPIVNFTQNLEQLKDRMPQLIQECVQELDYVIEDLIAAQLSKGMRGDGVQLPKYSSVSVAVFGKPAGPMKLKDTGDFYQGIAAKANAKDFEIYGTDFKTDMLEKKYGEAIIQLSDESLQEFIFDWLEPLLSEKANKLLTRG